MRRNILFVFIVLFFILIHFVLSAQEATPLSLKQAQDYALKNAFRIKNAHYDVENAKLQINGLIGVGLPQIQASVQYQNYIDLPTSIVPGDFLGMPGRDLYLKFGMPHQVSASLSASQLLFNGSWLVGLQASKAYAGLKQKEIQKSEIETKKDVRDAYTLAAIAEDSYGLLKSSRDVMEALLSETRALYDAGFVEELDVDQLQLTLNDLDYQMDNAVQQIKITQSLLQFTIGMPLSENIQLTDHSESLLTDSSADLLSLPFSAHAGIDYQITQQQLTMQKLNLKNERSKILPTLSVFYNLQSQALRREMNFLDTSKPWLPIQLWGIQLNVPLFSGGQTMNAISRAKVEVRRMTDIINMTQEGSLLEYIQAKTTYEQALKNYHSTQDNLALAEKIMQKTNIKFKEGVSTSFEVSQHTSKTIQAKGAYIQAMLQLMNAHTALTKTLNIF